ncbi:hypothetical protein I5F68_22600, partial [Pseudomonas aeruginosa]|nr:hypothetical protein [Pseudomonas aeruginosa]
YNSSLRIAAAQDVPETRRGAAPPPPPPPPPPPRPPPPPGHAPQKRRIAPLALFALRHDSHR